MQTRAYDIERYLRIRSVSGATFSPSEDVIAFTTDITGISQVWRLDGPGEWPHQLTFGDSRVCGVTWSPTEELLLFRKDEGGNEREQLFLLSPDGSMIEPLTDFPEAIHTFGGWSHDGQRIAFSSNRRNQAYFDVYIQNIKTGEVDCVYQHDSFNQVRSWSPDDRFLLVSRIYSSYDNDLYLVSTETGEAVHLTPHEGPVRYLNQGTAWMPDSKGMYFTSDLGRDFLNPVYFDFDSRKMEFTADVSWDVESVNLSEDGRLMMQRTNVDGYSELVLKETATGTVLPSPFPGTGKCTGAAMFSRSAEKLAVGYASSTRTRDIWIYELRRNELTQATYSSYAGIAPDSLVDPELIHYESFDGLKIPAFVYLPRNAEGRMLPAIIDVHGGPEYQAFPRLDPVRQYFVQRGYILLVPNIRGSLGYGKAYSHLDDVRLRGNSVKDVVYGAEWLKQSGHADPQKIAVMGISYGGFMTLACLTMYPEVWAAGVDIVGAANFITFLKNTGPYRREHRIAEYGDPEKDGDFLREISPSSHVDKIRAPLMVIQGANDPRVPQSESEQIVDAIRKRGGVVDYLLFDDEGHGISKLKNQIIAYRAMADFLDKHLGT